MKVCFISPAGGGKDIASEHLSRLYGCNRYAFADKVKEVAEVYFPHLYNANNKPRWLLQMIGTMFREIDPEIWIKLLFQEIDNNKEDAKRYGYADESIVITDCRLPNEYEALKERGFIFIRINVDEEIRKQRMIERGDLFKDEDMTHHTESFYDTFDCDYEVENNGTLEEFKEQLNIVMNSIIRKG